jgi:succinate-semialdehyde dehydrogenase/glutarate-semialdehyde dehydrogenase
VFTKDIKHGVEVAQKISTGTVYINHLTGGCGPASAACAARLRPRAGGPAWKEFVNHKLIAVTDIDGAF